MRTCNICGLHAEPTIINWVFNGEKPIGQRCKACANRLKRERQKVLRESAEYRAHQNARNLAYIKARLKSDAEFRARSKAYQKEYLKAKRANDTAYREYINKKTRDNRAKRYEVSPELHAVHKARARQYQRDHAAEESARVMARKAAKLHRTPKWLSERDKQKIIAFYLQAKELTDTSGVVHVVDHVIPLRGRYVSGLHVPGNLQVITAAENLMKSNNFDVD